MHFFLFLTASLDHMTVITSFDWLFVSMLLAHWTVAAAGFHHALHHSFLLCSEQSRDIYASSYWPVIMLTFSDWTFASMLIRRGKSLSDDFIYFGKEADLYLSCYAFLLFNIDSCLLKF